MKTYKRPQLTLTVYVYDGLIMESGPGAGDIILPGVGAKSDSEFTAEEAEGALRQSSVWEDSDI